MVVVIVMAASVLGLAVMVPLIAVMEQLPEPNWLSPRWRVATGVALVVSFGIGAYHWGATALLAPHLVLFATLVAVSVIDLRTSRIPNRIVLPSLVVSSVMFGLLSALDGSTGQLTAALIGSSVYCTALLVPHLIYPRGMGFGDVKLSLLLGLFLGWSASTITGAIVLVLSAMVLGTVIGTAHGLVLMVRERRSVSFPFGPSLAVSTVIALVADDLILSVA